MSGATGGNGFETRAIHAGQDPDPVTGAVVTPISLATTFAQSEVGEHRGFEYGRTGNPTRAALETCLASLEGARHGFAFASGMAAEDAVLRRLVPGDHVVIPDDAYGGTYRLVAKVLAAGGITWTAVDLTSTDALRAAMRPETRVVWIETPTNPMLTVVDIAAVAEVAHGRGASVVVDNTFATPYLQQPLRLGADIVIHSTTKYLGGHSDVIGGALVLNDQAVHGRLKFLQNAVGAVPGPLDCFLVLRGTKTLAVRMDQHCRNARRIAQFFATHSDVERVCYPGLPDHPGWQIARRQMRDFGGVITVELRGGLERNLRFVSRTRTFALAESLGGVESLIGHPTTMTHAAIPEEQRQKSGLAAAMVRLPVGIEDVDDLIEDLERAIAASK